MAAFDEARAAAEAVELIFPAEEIHDVAVCGMGGSAIAADLLLGAYRERLRKPMTVVRDYYLPGWIGENTLVILSSYSGGTEETLTCASQAMERNALCVAITSGGKLGTFYADEGIPVVPVAPGYQPRAALLRILTPIVVLLDRMGVLPPLGGRPRRGARDARRRDRHARPRRPRGGEPGQAARPRRCAGAIPHVLGRRADRPGGHALEGPDQRERQDPRRRPRCCPSSTTTRSCGFAGMPAELQKLSALVMLRDPRQHRQVQRRFDLTRELVEMHVGQVLSITAEGEGPLARSLDLVTLGDYASIYLALLRAVDPGPVDVIERLKGRLAETGYGRAQAQ